MFVSNNAPDTTYVPIHFSVLTRAVDVVVDVFCKRPCRVRLQSQVLTSVNIVASGAQKLLKNCQTLVCAVDNAGYLSVT